jgi:Kef-type K+ transport system membrane component KefB
VVRGGPAALYARAVGRTHALAAGFMQATSLTFIVVATVIGVQTGHQRPSTATALVVAGLLSVVIYPPLALRLLHSAAARPAPPEPDSAPQSVPRPDEEPLLGRQDGQPGDISG